MSESTHRPKAIADNLGISPATLRLWSNKFAQVLSPAAQKAQTETGTSAQRRYTDQDVAYFQRAKELLHQGKTYEETLAVLQAEDEPSLTDPTAEESPTSQVAIPTLDEHPVFLAFREALSAKDETIEALRTTITATERNLEDLRLENERLRLDLELRSQVPTTTPEPTLEVTRSPQKRLSWWDRLLGREQGHGG